jgi:hypothetical protein
MLPQTIQSPMMSSEAEQGPDEEFAEKLKRNRAEAIVDDLFGHSREHRGFPNSAGELSNECSRRWPAN